MTETLHWYAETTGGVRQGDAPVHPGCGALHLSADLPAGTLKTVRVELPWTMEADERLFMNGYQTWTYSPELDRNGKLRGTDHIPAFLRKKYAFDRYGDYHFVPYGHQKGQSHGFSYCYFRKGKQFRLVASLDEKPGYTILRYDSGKALLGNVFLTSDMPSRYTQAQRVEYRRLRTLFERATQVQAEMENGRLYIRYLLGGTPQKLCFDPF